MKYFEGIAVVFLGCPSGSIKGGPDVEEEADESWLFCFRRYWPEAFLMICSRSRVIFKHCMPLGVTSGPKNLAQKRQLRAAFLNLAPAAGSESNEKPYKP